MIWLATETEAAGATPWLVIRDEVAEALAVAGRSDDWTTDIVQAVAAFCDRMPRLPGLADLRWLSALALWRLGEARAAEQVMALNGRQPWSPDLARAAGDTVFWRLVRERVFYITSWRTLHVQPVWVIDFARLPAGLVPPMELLVFRVVEDLVKRLAGAWDGTRGADTLGWRGWRPWLARVFPPAQAQRIGNELWDHGAATLSALARSRDWPRVPTLVAVPQGSDA